MLPIIGLNNLLTLIKSTIGTINEINWANVFNSTVKDSTWFLNQSISPGRMAVGYPLMYVLYRILDEVKPSNILEFGLGQSTRMLNQYCMWQTTARVTTIEQNKEWFDIFTSNIKLANNLAVAIHPMEFFKFKGKVSGRSIEIEKTTGNNIYDLILVDGPFGTQHYARSQVFQLLPGNINPNNFCIIIDDWNRKGEQQTAAEVLRILTKHGIKFKTGNYSGEKKFWMVCSPNLYFTLTY